MNDFLTFAIASGLTYGISQACSRAKPKPPRKPRATIKEPPRPTLRVRPTIHSGYDFPVRPRETAAPHLPVDAQNEAIAPRKQRAPRHSASGPFGMTQEQFKQAQRNSFKWSVPGSDAPAWDGTNNGWLDDESINPEKENTDG